MGINPAYLKPEMHLKLQKALLENPKLPLLVLDQFLEEEQFAGWQRILLKSSFVPEWKPLTHSFAKAKIPSALQDFLHSPELERFLFGILGKPVRMCSADLLQCTWKDYTLLHDSAMLKPGFDLILDMAESWDERWGGSLYYVDGTSDYTKIPARQNRLIVAERKKSIQRFIEYVNHHGTGKNRRLLVCCFTTSATKAL